MKRVFTFILLLLAPAFAFAWGQQGHYYVAQFAETKISAKTDSVVQHYLGTETFAYAANWMDVNRKPYPQFASWHYVNIEKGGTYQDNPKGDVVNELTRAISVLKNYKMMIPDSVHFYLHVLFHLCGDITQPLHAGYGSDLGGNKDTVLFNNKKTNLHKIWDSQIIESGNITLTSCIVRSAGWSTQKIAAVQAGTPLDWMNDSRQLLPVVYKIKNQTITPKYISSNVPVVEEQIAKGGYRLAAILTQIFGS